MGLFDKKKKDDAGSPVDEISPSPSGPAPLPAQLARAALAAPREDASDFGINKAIELMRQLPSDNTELVVTVVKTTLEALNIKLATIIRDADRKLKGIEANVDGLRREIDHFEKEIMIREEKITALENDHIETTEVRDSLTLAETLAEKAHPDGAAVPK